MATEIRWIYGVPSPEFATSRLSPEDLLLQYYILLSLILFTVPQCALIEMGSQERHQQIKQEKNNRRCVSLLINKPSSVADVTVVLGRTDRRLMRWLWVAVIVGRTGRSCALAVGHCLRRKNGRNKEIGSFGRGLGRSVERLQSLIVNIHAFALEKDFHVRQRIGVRTGVRII